MYDFMQLAWLIPVMPFILFAFIGICLMRFPRTAATVSILGIAANFVLSLGVAITTFQNGPDACYNISFPWIQMQGFEVEVGLLIDPLAALMLVVVTFIALLVQIYSLGYMHGDPGFSRYYAYQSLFSGSMLGLVLADNFGQLFIFWELVGICSFLLIGFWFGRISAKNAAKKAFITNRVGDLGFLLGIVLIQATFGTLNFEAVTAGMAYVGLGLITLISILLFIGPIGKSAQFPLHVWLPDAMEGPTPVSALIHAATMVAAGVYLLARCFMIFSASPQAMTVIGIVGGFTALFAASIALVQNDIKRILAYSTLSQLGYMVMAMGVSAMTAGIFHLMTHAFFKSMLFLGAGSVIHAMHDEQDIWKMGNLSKKMPITTWTFVIGALALAGIPPLSGFWSKDEILLGAFSSGHYFLYGIASLVAFMTAFYMFRLIFVAFFGSNHGGEAAHESPAVMTVPLILLAILSVGIGLVNSPVGNYWLSAFITYPGAEHHAASPMIMIISAALALAGIYLAYLIYQKQRISAEALKEKFSTAHRVLTNKYYIDEFYAFLIAKCVDAVAAFMFWFDTKIVNGFINWLANSTGKLGKLLSYTEDGQVQTYALCMYAGALLIVVLSIFAACYAVFQ